MVHRQGQAWLRREGVGVGSFDYDKGVALPPLSA